MLEAMLDLERVSSDTRASIQVMTMHRAKGLEFEHVLLYGLYANADVARASIAELPSGLRKHSPWIRSVASVQKALLKPTP